jgi:hypothetical protein
MADEKDRFGEKLRDKQKGEEDRYFGERNRELVQKLREKKSTAAAAMRCPKDGAALATIERAGVTVEECPQCGGVWFDKGEMETVAKREKDSWLGRLVYGPRK